MALRITLVSLSQVTLTEANGRDGRPVVQLDTKRGGHG